MSNEMEPLPCACGNGLVVTDSIVGRFQTWCLCGRCTAKHKTREDAIVEWNVTQAAITEHQKRKEMAEMMEAAIPDDGTDTKAEPLRCICGCGYVACENANYGWYGACSEATCGIRTGFWPTAADARKCWNTIQRALRPDAVTLELPEPPEGWAWNHEILMVDTTEQLVPGCTIRISAKPIPPTPAEIRERSQAWAAQQPPGTVARYTDRLWFINQPRTTPTTGDFKIVTDGFGAMTTKPWGARAVWADDAWEWQEWPPCLDGIGPEHVVCSPSEAVEEE